MIELPITISHLDRIAAALEIMARNQSAARFTFKITLGGLMAIFKADKPDFDAAVMITAKDSEDNVINDAPIPAGFLLTVSSDNPAAITATQDAADPRLVHYHVGGPGQASVQADLLDAAGNLVATGAELVTVTVGDPAAITAINLNLPSA